ncbi:hypothetical protein E2C01_090552 [Portunus trituberculatus]|uniref:Uncharacterized protein n=1 Tax=Portunus trituberculatus TaxID=210409 RepID=A0A5B7JL60_PORTR|nr:hypothetical protein [Portunus trituberculatus]
MAFRFDRYTELNVKDIINHRAATLRAISFSGIQGTPINTEFHCDQLKDDYYGNDLYIFILIRSPLLGRGPKNFPRSDYPPISDPKCLDTSLNVFLINFCNIRGLRFNFQFVEHHLSSNKPYLLFLTETQLSEDTGSRPCFVPSYFLYSHFPSKARCCVYVHNELTCSCAHALESSEFSILWLRLNSTLKLFFSVLSMPPRTPRL